MHEKKFAEWLRLKESRHKKKKKGLKLRLDIEGEPVVTNSFKEWMTRTPDELFGFDSRKSLNNNRIQDMSDEVFKPLRFDLLINELVHLGPVNTKSPIKKFNDQVEWGDQPGAWTAVVSPEGSLRFTLRKLSADIEGDPIWVCKKVVPLQGQEFVNSEFKETNIAHVIFSELTTLDNEMLDAPKDYFPEFERLVIRISDATRRDHPIIFVHEGIKKINDFNYIIYHSYRGHGVELPSALRCEQFDINCSFSPSKGTIRIWGNEIISRTKQHEWRQRTPRWNEMFMPSQSQQEITDCITKLFSTY